MEGQVGSWEFRDWSEMVPKVLVRVYAPGYSIRKGMTISGDKIWHSPGLESTVALVALREQGTITQWASRFGVRSKWMTVFRRS